MSEWQVITPAKKQPRDKTDVVRVLASGLVVISTDIAARLGNPSMVQFLRNGTNDMLAIRAATTRMSAYAFKSYGGAGSRAVSGWNGLKVIGRLPSRTPVNVPYRWDGDVLVIDVSGLPMREKQQ